MGKHVDHETMNSRYLDPFNDVGIFFACKVHIHHLTPHLLMRQKLIAGGLDLCVNVWIAVAVVALHLHDEDQITRVEIGPLG
jgi:phosphoribosylcarboxyaminoimidazole (NCAIR) mutase